MNKMSGLTLALLLFAVASLPAQEAQPGATYGTIPTAPTISTYTMVEAYPIAKTLINQTIALTGTARQSLSMPTGVWIYLTDGTNKIIVEKKFSAAVANIDGKYVKLYGMFAYNAAKKFVFNATAVSVYTAGPVMNPSQP